MQCYASHTGTRRNLAALRAHGWGLLVSRGAPPSHWNPQGFEDYVLDNGAWSDFQQGRSFDADAFERLLDKLGAAAQWVVLPDIVAGGLASLELSLRWSNRVLSATNRVLIAVQDGMVPTDVAPFVGRKVGIFLGGSTPWKLAQMALWGAFCRTHGVHYHVARVNTERRTWQAIAAGADSIDGSSGTRYAVTIPMLTRAASQRDLFAA
jgi:hypothetical protein